MDNNSPNEEPSTVVREERNHEQSPIKSVDVAIEIIKDILVKDMERSPQESQTFKLLDEFSGS